MNKIDGSLCDAITGNIQTLCILVAALSDCAEKDELVDKLPNLIMESLQENIGHGLLVNLSPIEKKSE